MIVVDASLVVSGLLGQGPARARLESDALHAPHLVDAEVVAALRKLVMRDEAATSDAERALAVWRRMGVRRHPMVDLIGRMWELRDTVSTYDAAHVALAEVLHCNIVTLDHRLAAATGPRCTIEISPQ